MKAVRGISRHIAPERPARRGARIGWALVALSGIFFAVNFAQEWWTSNQIKQNAANLQRQIILAEQYNAQLSNDIKYYNSKDYILNAARSFGMARPGDAVMMINQGPARERIIHVRKPPPQQEDFFTSLLHGW